MDDTSASSRSKGEAMSLFLKENGDGDGDGDKHPTASILQRSRAGARGTVTAQSRRPLVSGKVEGGGAGL